jgi:hypothetical protein
MNDYRNRDEDVNTMTTMERESEVVEQIVDVLNDLDLFQKQLVLGYALSIRPVIGEPIEEFIKRAAAINFPKEDLAEIARIIEEDFGKIDWDDWHNPPSFDD